MTKKSMCYTVALVLSVALIGCKGQAKPEDVPVSGGWEMADHEHI